MDMPWFHYGRAEATGNADDDPLVSEHFCHHLGRAEPILHREHHRLGPEQRPRALGSGVDLHRLGRDDDQVDRADLGGIRGGTDPDDAVAARPLHTHPVLAYGGDVLSPRIDCPDVVTGIT